VDICIRDNFDLRKEAVLPIVSLAYEYTTFKKLPIQKLLPVFVEFLASQDLELVKASLQFIASLVQHSPRAGVRMLTEANAPDNLELLLTMEDAEVRIGASRILDLVYGSANATPALDSGANTPRR